MVNPILVTGAAGRVGAIGRTLTELLLKQGKAVRAMVRLSGWTIGYVVANQVALAFVLIIARSRTGVVSAYTYAYAFFQLPHGLLAVSIMTILGPELRDAGAQTLTCFGLHMPARIFAHMEAPLPSLAAVVPDAQSVECGLAEDGPNDAGEILHGSREQLLGGLAGAALAMVPRVKADSDEPRSGQFLQAR